MESLAFSGTGRFLLSLGGIDDEIIAIWDLNSLQPIASSKVCPDIGGSTTVLGTFNKADNQFITAGETTLRIWEIDETGKGCKIRPTDVNLTGFKRNFTCVTVSADDKYLYAGTSTGDIVMTTTSTKLLKCVGPEKVRFSGGVKVLMCMSGTSLLAAAGDGTINFVSVTSNDTRPVIKKTKSLPKFDGAITSVVDGRNGDVLIGTSKCYIYACKGDGVQLVKSCHSSEVNHIAFPAKSSAIFCTGSLEEIRTWQNAPGKPIKELHRIVMRHMACLVLVITPDGCCILSGWSDGRIRAFYPETAKHMYTIDGAHQKGVTAIECFHQPENSFLQGQGHSIITGGGDGKVRIWWIEAKMTYTGDAKVAQMVHSLDQHKDAITSICIRNDNKYCISSSKDGSFILWDLEHRPSPRNAICTFPIPNTACTKICFDPDESYYILTSANGKLVFRSTGGTPIGEYDVTPGGAIHHFDRSRCGSRVVTASQEGSIKLWALRECDSGMGDGTLALDVSNTSMGVGHGGPVKCAKFSPCGSYVVSVGADGAIIRWRVG